jgi:TRAP-type C4-dicarboxylate transport system permease small subunit
MTFPKIQTWLERLGRVFALCGGGLFCGMALIVLVSIVGRVVFGRPVAGDFEIVALCTAVSIFLCLPYCHLQRGNVVVDLLLRASERRLRRWLDAVAAIFYAGIAAIFAWRMSAGLVDAIRYEDVSIIIGLPLWWAYPPAIASFLLLAVSCIATAVNDLKGPSG